MKTDAPPNESVVALEEGAKQRTDVGFGCWNCELPCRTEEG